MKVLLNPSCSLGQKVKLSLNAAQLISFEAAFLAAAVIAVGHRQRQFSHWIFTFSLPALGSLRARLKKSKKNELNKRIYELRKSFGPAGGKKRVGKMVKIGIWDGNGWEWQAVLSLLFFPLASLFFPNKISIKVHAGSRWFKIFKLLCQARYKAHSFKSNVYIRIYFYLSCLKDLN